MKNEYSDSLIPFGIGTSFFLLLILLMSAGAGVGYLLRDYPVFPQAGGIILFIIFVTLVLLPVLYNKKKSPFEGSRTVLARYDGIGTIGGLRGALFRILLYEDGIEVRAFYHRYYIPFEKIKKIATAHGSAGKRLIIETGIAGVPDSIVAADPKFWALVDRIKAHVKT